MASKPFYLSKTFWVNVAALVALVVAQFSPKVAEFIQANFSELGSAWAVINFVLRLVSNGKLEITSSASVK
jgi:hypothetical protein